MTTTTTHPWPDSILSSNDDARTKLQEVMPLTTFYFAEQWMVHARLFAIMAGSTVVAMEHTMDWFWTEHDKQWSGSLDTMRRELQQARVSLMQQPCLKIVGTRPETGETYTVLEVYGINAEAVRITSHITLLPTGNQFMLFDTSLPHALPFALENQCVVPHLGWTVLCSFPDKHENPLSQLFVSQDTCWSQPSATMSTPNQSPINRPSSD